MKQNLLLFTLFIFTLLLSSCSGSLNTFADYDKNTDLNKYKSYAWLAPGDPADSPQNYQVELTYSKMVLYIANDNLKKKGMIIDTVSPDALFKFSMGIETKTAYSQSPTVSVGVAVGGPGYYAPGYYGGMGYYGGVSVPVSGGKITEHRADEAFLYIQMFDTKTGALLWTGGARKTVDNSADTQKSLTLALQSVLSNLKIKHKTK